ncbi:MAG: hypothetical protein ACK5QW_06110 [Cyanobacteriota bacterium]|jgi:hypothetical protein
MAFKNEVVSDEDIDRYHLPFPKGEGRWWTRDAERDYYLWGGLTGNRAFDPEQEGKFFLYTGGFVYHVALRPGERREDPSSGQVILRWNELLSLRPEASGGDKNRVLDVLREALVVYGSDGRRNIFCPDFRVLFGF